MPLRAITTLIVALALVSCDSRGFKPCYPAQGRILVNGKPENGAVVMFHSLDDQSPRTVKSRGVTNDDGAYTMYTYNENDGAPAGNYVVTVTHFRKSDGTNLLPGRYAEASTSDLRARIDKKTNELPTFDLSP